MIWLSVAAGLLIAVLGVWLLIETQRTGRSRFWLALAIPILMAWPVGLEWYGSSLLGYATTDKLKDEFVVIHAYPDDGAKTVYALVRVKGDTSPRLYMITGNFEQNRKIFARAQVDTEKGLIVGGRRSKSDAGGSPGEFVMYVLPPSGVPSKS